MDQNIAPIQSILTHKIIAVLAISDIEDAPFIADALIAGGVRNIEMTLRTESALDILTLLVQKYPELNIGAGTVLTTEQLEQVKDTGAPFAVAPGFNPRILDHANMIGLPFFPGVATPSDIEGALEFGCRLLKFFPAEAMGGLNYLKTMQAPYAHLGLQFIPLGGIKPANLPDYIKSPLIGGVGGSWLAPKDLIEAKDWKKIQQNAAEAVKIIEENK